MTTLGGRDVRRMIRTVRPDWSVDAWHPAEEGTDFVAIVECRTPAGDRDVVIKACTFVDSPAFRPEPRLLRMVDERTDLPVPRVLSVHEARDDEASDGPDRPFFLMERVDGDQLGGPDDLSPAALERLARTAGDHLAQLHELADWGAYGTVRCAEDASVHGPADLGVGDCRESWRELLRATAVGSLDTLHQRFADLESDLRAAVDRRLVDVPETPPAAFLHCDYRYGNLLLDAESGEPTAVLDWGNHTTGDPANDLVNAVNYLSGWAGIESERRTTVREGMLEGYRQQRPLERDPDTWHAYQLVSWLPPLRWFDLWYGDASEVERDAIERRHREGLVALR